MKELNDCVDKLVEFSARGAHGICAVRTFSTRGVAGTVSEIVPENVPLLDAVTGRDGKRTFRFKTVHRGDDSRAISRRCDMFSGRHSGARSTPEA